MNSYQESQAHILEARRLLATDAVEEARAEYAEAARLQCEFVASLPEARVRTASVYGLSAATLYYRAQMLKEAEHVIHSILGREYVDDSSRRQLQDLLSRIWNERQMEEMGYGRSSAPVAMTLRHGEILNGLAPTDAVDIPLRSVLSLFQRVAAWLAHLPLTRSPEQVLAEKYRAFSSEPLLGSYRIDLYLASPSDQLFLDMPEHSIQLPPPDEVTSSFRQVVGCAAHEDYAALAELVPDVHYRQAMIRLVRNIVPDGVRVGEVEFRSPGEPKENAVLLYPNHRYGMRQMLRQVQAEAGETGGPPQGEAVQHSGILRAVDLDRNLLRLDRDGDKMDFQKADDILDDAVGPLLNKRVTITGSHVPRKKRFYATDIEMEMPTGGEP